MGGLVGVEKELVDLVVGRAEEVRGDWSPGVSSTSAIWVLLDGDFFGDWGFLGDFGLKPNERRVSWFGLCGELWAKAGRRRLEEVLGVGLAVLEALVFLLLGVGVLAVSVVG